MPFGKYKDFADCKRKNKGKVRDVDAYCGWLKQKIEGGDPDFLMLLMDPELTLRLYLTETGQAQEHEVLQLMTRARANAVLDNPELLRKVPPSVVIDDHRWVHMWANAVKDGKDVFLDKNKLRKLHQILVDEMARRGMDAGFSHKSPLKFGGLELAAGYTPLETMLNKRRAFLLDSEFISLVGSSVLGKTDADLDLLLRTTRELGYKKALKEVLPKDLAVDFVWEPSGAHGPYIPVYELWAIPVKNPQWKEPVFNIQPLSPMLPAMPQSMIEDPYELYEDSYFIEQTDGIRAMIHRRESVIIAFDKELEEIDLPEQVATELLAVEDPRTFILDGFLTREDGAPVYRMIDMPWWRGSEHITQTTESRRSFLMKLPDMEHCKTSKAHYFTNRADTIEFLKGEAGPYLLIPGNTEYPVQGYSKWLIYQAPVKGLQLQEGADAQIKSLVDGGQWEGKSASERFSLMTKRKRVEPLYPFAQMKTTKKGYSQKEVFGLKSVEELAKDLYKVPSKQAVEAKVDGFRGQVHKKGDQVRIFTESGHEITKQIPKIVAGVKSVPAKSFIIDTEATPYDEGLNNLGRAGAVPAFAKGAKGPVDDSRWALHVFDILEIDGEEIHHLPYEERRQRLRGLELPIRDAPKSTGDFRLPLWENHVYWATSAEQMVKFAEQVSKVPGSEGAMFKDADSKYRLSGNTPLWSKMKSSFEIDALVVGVNRDGGVFNYIGAIGPVDAEADTEAPVDSPKGKKFVKWKGKIYSILGKTFNTKIKAEVGDIIRVSMKNVGKIEDKVYHWFHPQVLEQREDKTRPDPLETAQTIHETSKGQAKKSAYLVAARFGGESPLACCNAPWVAFGALEPRTEEERAKAHFNISDEDWAKLTEDEKEEYIRKLPPRGQRLEWTYLGNLRDVCSELHSMGVEKIIGSRMDRETLELITENRMIFEPTSAESISDYEGGFYEDLELSNRASLDEGKLKRFLEEIRTENIECMKLSCGSCIPLQPVKKLANLFLTNPDEDKKWRYTIQFHGRGLSVHGDLRLQISPSQAIGWTWNTGKSLVKPMLRRTAPEMKVKAGLSSSDLNLPNTELSQKLRSTTEGRQLYKTLRKKTQDLEFKTLKAMMNELWDADVVPVLKNPSLKILTQIKHPMSVAWLDYEQGVPAGAVGATREMEGQFVIMDKGTVEYGTQKSYFHEYWLNGEKIKDRRVIIRRLATRKKWQVKESFAWMTFFSKPEQVPYAISRRAVNQDWVPPEGVSAIPASVRSQIPKDRQYWKAKNTKAIRNALVDDIKGRRIQVRLAESLQFSVKRVWHKGPEVRRGLPVTRYWLILHSGNKIYDAWDFGKDSDPLEEDGLLARRRKTGGMKDLLKKTGTVTSRHPVSQTRKLKTHFDTSDTGSTTIIADSNNQLRLRVKGGVLKGEYIFVKESGEMWTFKKISMPEAKKAMLLAAADCGTMSCPTTGVLHLAADDMDQKVMGDILIISGPAIKPGEVLPMDGKPSFFTKEGIKKFWPSMHRQPIVVLHGDLKGDVIGFVDKIHFDEKTGWGWIDRGVIWHPLGIKLILEKKLPSFSIEVIPESIWDGEHQHEHVMGGRCVGLAVVPKGACVTCNPITAQMGRVTVGNGKVYKFGMTTEAFILEEYWRKGRSTQEISVGMGIPRSTIESWMKKTGIPRRDYKEARNLRRVKELAGRSFITALGTGAVADTQQEGKNRRNYTATLFSMGNEHLLINAPKGITTMLGNKRLKPNYVLLEHKDAVGGLHELRPLKPNVFATKETWDYLRQNYRELSEQKGTFEEIYDLPRYVIKDNAFISGPFIVGPIETKQALAFKIDMSGKVVWHGSNASELPEEALEGVDVYIGGGEDMEKQIGWAKEASIPQIFFTQIGRGRTHEELNKELQEISPNVQVLHDGAEVPMRGGNPGARFSAKMAQMLIDGEIEVIVRAKPYQDYPRQAIYLLGEENVYGLYVEGFPEGPLKADQVRTKMKEEHALSDAEWKKQLGDIKEVWIYRPRILRKYPEIKEYRLPEFFSGPYVHDVKLAA